MLSTNALAIALPDFHTLILNLRQSYIDRGLAESFYAINDGLCDEFAEDLRQLAPAEIEVLAGEMFMTGIDGDPCENDVWDWDVLEAWGIPLPEGFTKETLNAISFGGHEWVYRGGRHYDAECPSGVDSFFALPLYKRYLEQA